MTPSGSTFPSAGTGIGSPAVPSVVLDTNVLLDWLVFKDPRATRWYMAIETKSVHWLSTRAMREEFDHVLGRGVGRAWSPDLHGIALAWTRHCRIVEPPAPTGVALRVRCTDPDDQKFVDLALGWRTTWLVSRDRAVLRLRRRTQALGLRILTPEQWADEIKTSS